MGSRFFFGVSLVFLNFVGELLHSFHLHSVAVSVAANRRRKGL